MEAKILFNAQNKIRTIKDAPFYAKGDGVTDDSAAFQLAEDYFTSIGGGTIYVPPGVYIVSEPFYHRNNVVLEGVGDESIIRNNVAINNGNDQFCIHIGNFDPDTFVDCLHFDVNDVVAGENQITLVNPANSSFFTIGKAVLVDSIAGFMSEVGNHWKPYVGLINNVTAINTISGVITLEDPVSVDINGAQIAPTDKFVAGSNNDPDKTYICQRPTIRKIRFESLGDWTLRWGVYKGLFEDISIKSTDAIGGNGFSQCLFRNIIAEFSQKVVEMALYSHDTVIDGMIATWWNGALDPTIKPLLKFGENQRDCDFSNIFIDSGNGPNFGMVIRMEHAFNNKVHNCDFQCQIVSQDGVLLEASGSDSIVIGNEVKDNNFVLGNTDYYIHLTNNDVGAVVSGNVVTGNTFSGGVNNQNIRLDGNVGANTTSPNTFI